MNSLIASLPCSIHGHSLTSQLYFSSFPLEIKFSWLTRIPWTGKLGRNRGLGNCSIHGRSLTSQLCFSSFPPEIEFSWLPWTGKLGRSKPKSFMCLGGSVFGHVLVVVPSIVCQRPWSQIMPVVNNKYRLQLN